MVIKILKAPKRYLYQLVFRLVRKKRLLLASLIRIIFDHGLKVAMAIFVLINVINATNVTVENIAALAQSK
jgi:hypothetical protein